jgi:hypothetical protein
MIFAELFELFNTVQAHERRRSVTGRAIFGSAQHRFHTASGHYGLTTWQGRIGKRKS